MHLVRLACQRKVPVRHAKLVDMLRSLQILELHFLELSFQIRVNDLNFLCSVHEGRCPDPCKYHSLSYIPISICRDPGFIFGHNQHHVGTRCFFAAYLGFVLNGGKSLACITPRTVKTCSSISSSSPRFTILHDTGLVNCCILFESQKF